VWVVGLRFSVVHMRLYLFSRLGIYIMVGEVFVRFGTIVVGLDCMMALFSRNF